MQQGNSPNVCPLAAHLIDNGNTLWHHFFFVRLIGKRANIGTTV
jgi:hypothetical protein